MRTWLITGVSSGFGRALAQLCLDRGDRVIGTLRNESQRADFEALVPGRSFGVLLDVTRDTDVVRVINGIEQNVGAIDVLVNNAGYGFESTVEEASMSEVRAQFETNVFGAVAVIQAVLPSMRRRRSGHIINITSMGGIVTFPGLGIYHGSKFALEGITEALGKEVSDFGIKVIAVEPGGFRTDWAGRSMRRGDQHIADYEPLFAPLRKARAERSGKQVGDPAKAASAIYAIVGESNPPAHLLLGTDALSFVSTKIENLQTEIGRWAHVTTSTDVSH